MTELENVFHMGLQTPQRAAPDRGTVEQSGKAILALLQQAADAAQRNEGRARQQAQLFAEELQNTETQLRRLQAELSDATQRAVQTEEWLLRIFKATKEGLVEPLTRGQDIDRDRLGHAAPWS